MHASDRSDSTLPPVIAEVTITVMDVNEVPSFAGAPYNFTQPENTVVNTVINSVTITDPEEGSLTYSLTVGGDHFEIDGSSGEIRNKVLIDYEVLTDDQRADGITVTVQVLDGPHTIMTDVVIMIEDVNEASSFNGTPPFIFPQAENTPLNTQVGSITATDPEEVNLTYSLTGGSGFTINASGGISNTDLIDYEMLSSADITVTITVTDGTNLVTTDVTIRITDVNEAPIFAAAPYTFMQAENTSTGAVGTVLAQDEDTSDTPIYSFVDGSGSSASATVTDFSINPTTGQISVAATLDYERTSSYTLYVLASDNGSSILSPVTAAVTITVTDVNEAPVFTLPTSFTVAEDATSIGVVTTTSPASLLVAYSIVPDSDLFEIDGSSGALSVISGQSLDFETAGMHTLTVRASAGSEDTNQEITINVTDVDESPVFNIVSSSLTQAENATIGTPIGTVTATDPDGDALSYILTVGGDRFAIDAGTGEITNEVLIDYEALNSTDLAGITVRVQATAMGVSIEMDFIITITDVSEVAPTNDAPIFDLDEYTFTQAENTVVGTLVGTVTATDPISSAVLTYSFEQRAMHLATV